MTTKTKMILTLALVSVLGIWWGISIWFSGGFDPHPEFATAIIIGVVFTWVVKW